MQPQMLVVSDIDDVFVPSPDDLLVNLSESRSVVDVFLDSLPSMFQNTSDMESAFGPAVKAAAMTMVCQWTWITFALMLNSFSRHLRSVFTNLIL